MLRRSRSSAAAAIPLFTRLKVTMNIFRTAVLVSGVLLSAWNVSAQVVVHTSTAVTEEMLFADDPKDWAKPKVVVPPDFPADQLAVNARGYVDIAVTLDAYGKVKTAQLTKSEPANPAFEKAAMEVVRHWIFHAMFSQECVPVESAANVRTWFELRDGKGVVSVSGAATSTTPSNGLDKSAWLNRREVAALVKYPAAARRDSIQADANAAIRVNAATGAVADVEVTWLETSPQASTTVIEEIKKAIRTPLMSAKFEPRAGGENKTYRVCVPYTFRVSRR